MASLTLSSPLSDEQFSVEFASSMLDVEKMVQAARDAFHTWDRMGFAARGALIRNVCKGLEEQRSVLAQIVHRETGKPITLALGEIDAAIEFGYLISAFGRYPIGNLLPATVSTREVLVRRIPIGVAALLVSYNTPLPNYAWKTFPALLAGNTVILKPSEFTTQSALAFFELFNQAGFPEGVFNLVLGGKSAGEKLVSANVDLVSFTGSHSSGLEVERASAGKLRKLILELGGNNPLIVFSDANYVDLMDYAVNSAFSNSGQRCAAGSRFLLQDSLRDDFLTEFLARSARLQIGTSSESDVGPLISTNAAIAFEEYLGECERFGARVERIGKKSAQWSSCSVMPAVIYDLKPEIELSQKEIFGPAVRVYSFQNEEEAVNLANGTPYGLTAAVWTRDSDLASRVCRDLVCGLVNVNGPTHGSEFNFPFGGLKGSGNGTQDAGIESISQYSTFKVTTVFRS